MPPQSRSLTMLWQPSMVQVCVRAILLSVWPCMSFLSLGTLQDSQPLAFIWPRHPHIAQ